MAAIRKDMILMQIVKIPYSEMNNRYGSKKIADTATGNSWLPCPFFFG